MNKRALAFALALAALAAGHLALRRYSFSLPLMSDEGEYAYEARLWSGGGLPYRDAYFQKPPMVAALYRLAYAALPGDLLAPRRLAVAFSLFTMLLLFLLSPRSWNPAARLVASALYGIWSTSPIGSVGFAANTEVFLCAFTSLGALAASRHIESPRPGRWVFLCGLASGLAFATKQTAVWTALLFGFVCLLGGRRRPDWRMGLAFLCGAALAPAAFTSYFSARGGLGALLDDVYRRNGLYASMVVLTSSGGARARWFLRAVVPQFLAGDWPAWGAALLGLAFTRARLDSVETLATLWLGAGLTGAATGLLFFPYYFLQAFPPLAVAAAIGIERLAENVRGRWPAWLAAGALCAYPVLVRGDAYFRDSPRALADRLLYPNPLFEAVDIADYIRSRTTPRDTIYVFGSEPHIYVYAGRRCATEHIFAYPLTFFPGGPAEIEQELAKLKAAGPKFIVYSCQPGSTIIVSRLGESFRDGVRDLLRRRYRLVARLDMESRRGGEARLEAVGGTPDWSSRSCLFIFERKP